MKAEQRVGASGHTAVIVLYLLLGGFQFQTFFLYEIADHPKLFYVGWGVEAYAFVVALRVDDGEFAFPKT